MNHLDNLPILYKSKLEECPKLRIRLAVYPNRTTECLVQNPNQLPECLVQNPNQLPECLVLLQIQLPEYLVLIQM